MNDETRIAERRLESWKEIAEHLVRKTTTARRWEREEGLPVHRHTHNSRSSVYTYPSEIDAWRASRKVVPEPVPARPLWKIPAFGATMLLCLVMVGNGIRPKIVSAQQTGPGDRAVWTGQYVDLFGRVSPDGRYITYVDWWKTGGLMVHDVIENSDRPLTATPSPEWSQEAGYSTISKQGAQVAYSWNDAQNRQQLRVLPLVSKGLAEPRVLFTASEEVRFLSPLDWSPDGKWIAGTLARKDGTGQILLISTADGKVRGLKSVGWNVPERIFFSHDGKYIAYDLPADDTSDQRDIFVLAVDGSREIPAVVHPAQERLLGWSPDGSQLLFSSDRTGSVGLWSLKFSGGETQGLPELLRADIGSAFSLGLTASGSLYLYKQRTGRDTSIAPIDLAAGKLTGTPKNFVQGFLPGAQVPDWSPDGKLLAYSACGGDCLAIRAVDTGEVRRLPRRLLYTRDPRWSPDGRHLLVTGRDGKGRDGIYEVNAENGEASAVAYKDGLGGSPQWSPDGNKVYYQTRNSVILEKDLASGAEREVARHPLLSWQWALSPDGHHLVAQTKVDPVTKTSTLLLVSLADGRTRELLSGGPEHWMGLNHSIAWTPDSNAVLTLRMVGSKSELLRVPVDGSGVKKLDIDPDLWIRGGRASLDRGFTLSPDGRRIAFLMGNSSDEIWAVENLLPSPGKRGK